MDEILIHTCCGPCSSAAIPAWRDEGLEPTALFFNPNVQPGAEFVRRLEAMQQFAGIAGLRLLVREGGHDDWWAAVGQALLHEPPSDEAARRARCRACLTLRMRETAWTAARRGLSRFSTTLTISPHQHHDLVASAGFAAAEEAGVEFLYADHRGLYRRSLEESRRFGLYRQPYCGCAPSKWEAFAERFARRAAKRALRGRAA